MSQADDEHDGITNRRQTEKKKKPVTHTLDNPGAAQSVADNAMLDNVEPLHPDGFASDADIHPELEELDIPKETPDYNDFNRPLDPVGETHETMEFGVGLSQNQPGNYIFTVGRPGSGKSTFQSHMLRFLLNGGEHLTEPDPAFEKSKAFHETEKKWDESWRSGLFPESTAEGRPSEFRFIIDPIKKENAPPLRFGFLEISGEDFNEITEFSNEGPNLLPPIESLLKNPHCKIAFLFVCQGDNMDGDDFLFAKFVSYLDSHIDKSLRQKCSAALILANPDACQRRLQQKLNQEQTGGKLDIDKFIFHFAPRSATLLGSWKKRATMAPFSVGTLGQRTKPDGTTVLVIKDHSFDDARMIFEWLYEQFTGISLGPGFIERTKAWLQRLSNKR